jgi:hypothetical protein
LLRYGVDTEGIRPAATELVGRSELARSQLGACARLRDGLVDPRLTGGVAALADVAADVLELVAADLALLATKVRAGAMLYDRVEGAVGRGVSR